MEQQTLNPYNELGVEPGVTPKQLKQSLLERTGFQVSKEQIKF